MFPAVKITAGSACTVNRDELYYADVKSVHLEGEKKGLGTPLHKKIQ